MNRIQVGSREGVSRLLSCADQPPLKFISPKPLGGTCQVYLSNYGGGFLAGDEVRIDIECLDGGRLYLGTQSSNKIYRSPYGRTTVQEIAGTLHAKALTVVCPDPVVPFAGSRFRQRQRWTLHPDSELVLCDSLQSGREARGESFDFEAYENEIRFERPGGAPLVLERFAFFPREDRLPAFGLFGPFRSWLGVYLLGRKAEALGRGLLPALLRLSPPGRGPLQVTVGERPGLGILVRALGRERRDLQPVQDLLFSALSRPGWLGFNPWDRRW